MLSNTIQYAHARSNDEQRKRPSLTRLGLRLAIAVAAAQAVLLAVFFYAPSGLDGPALQFAVVALAFSTVVVWVIAVALTLAAWADGDGPRRFAVMALVLLVGEVIVPFALVLISK